MASRRKRAESEKPSELKHLASGEVTQSEVRRTTSPSSAPVPTQPVTLCRGGLQLRHSDGRYETLPLRAGSLQYFRIPRTAWRTALQALKSMELRVVETYVPWLLHERPDAGGLDFEGALDLAAFLREAQALGLYAIIRPGPHINAELTDFGLPARIVWSADCQARTPRQNPVILPAPPRAFPIPSYASEVFLQEADKYLAAVATELAELVFPKGPIVLVQVDNEGSMYFRDGTYDQDYHPDAISLYRKFLRTRYVDIDSLNKSYGTQLSSFDEVAPPTRYDVRSAEDLPRHLDWAESHEVLLQTAFQRMAGTLQRNGMMGVPFFHNLPMGEAATPLNPSQIRSSSTGSHVELIALDYYHLAGDHKSIARRTSELAAACDGLGHPAFAAEMGVGAPPYFPPLTERDSMFTLLCALAYGLRGYNLYMAVERDRWLGSPADRHGNLRPFAAFYKRLGLALEHTNFASLWRDTPVRLVVPRSVRRLSRVMHAFGPLTQVAFRIGGGGLRETVFEDDVDFGDGHALPPPITAGQVLVTFERAMEEEGVPFAMVDGSEGAAVFDGARLLVVPTSCGLDEELVQALIQAERRGVSVIFAPNTPLRDGTFRPRGPSDVARFRDHRMIVGDDAFDVSRVRAFVAEDLASVTRYRASPPPCAVTVHESVTNVGRQITVLFVVNPTLVRHHVTLEVPGVDLAEDLLDGTIFKPAEGVSVDAGSVRFCIVRR